MIQDTFKLISDPAVSENVAPRDCLERDSPATKGVSGINKGTDRARAAERRKGSGLGGGRGRRGERERERERGRERERERERLLLSTSASRALMARLHNRSRPCCGRARKPPLAVRESSGKASSRTRLKWVGSGISCGCTLTLLRGHHDGAPATRLSAPVGSRRSEQ